ncbi:MAG TPA: PIN domain-containing protein [Steroidobacteraceae bacterium]|nr:PIN domain-containing protein [Steroidobacteraceae bacterium]
MIWMFDTDILIYFVNRKLGFEQIARCMSGRSPGELRLSAITLAELKFGIENGEFRTENRRALTGVLPLFQADDLPSGAAQDFGEIETALLRKGKAIGTYDMLIAAHARHIGATVVTNNEREFRRVPGLAVQNWLKP